MKKIGETTIIAAFVILAAYTTYRLIRNKNFLEVNSEPDLIQVSNRLVEFFDKDNIEEAYRQYSLYIDMGIKPINAFEMTIKEK